jgi:hypothetical protein
VSHAGPDGNTFHISVRRTEVKKVAGKPRRKGDDDTKINIKGIWR